MKQYINIFWEWYEKHERLNTLVATSLFSLQILHLFWLTTDVVIPRLGGPILFPVSEFMQYALILVDYTEIPALISTSFIYINAHRKTFAWRNIIYLIFLNIQWIHLFWLTDEFVLDQFRGEVYMPFWLAWIAILIDYLELPVIIDTLKKTFKL